jgi:hypothetical protein
MKTRQDQNSETLIDQGKKSRGRPTKATDERKQIILDELSKGIPLTVTCRDLGIADSTVRDWMTNDETFSRDIAHARILGFDAIAMETLAIADDTSNDTLLIGEEGKEREIPNKEWIARSKLRVETRLKLLAKWDPKRYGDLMRQEISGPDGAPIAQTSVSLSPDQESNLAALVELAKVKAKK